MSTISAPLEAPRRRNACSNCRVHGHNIKNCTHPSVQALIQELRHAANYSIGYDHRAYIETWLENLNIKQLRILAYQYNIATSQQHLSILDKKIYYISQIINATYTSQPRSAIDRLNARDSLSGEQLIEILETIEIWVVRNTLLPLRRARNYGSTTPLDSGSLHTTPIQTIYHQGAVIRRNIRDINRRRAAANRIIANAHAQITNAQAEIANAQAQLNDLINTRTQLFVEYDNVENELNQFIENINIEPRKFDINMVEASVDNDSTKANDCPICYDAHTPENLITTNCNHTFCSPCLSKSFEVVRKTSSKHPICAMCRGSIHELTFNNNPVILKEMQDTFCSIVL
jgi:hypothetical protein